MVLAVLDVSRKVPLINPVVIAILLPAILNASLAGWLAYQSLGLAWLWTLALSGVLLLYAWLHLNIFPIMDGVPVGMRLKALGGATPILYALCYATIVQAVVLPLSFVIGSEQPIELLIGNAIFSIACCLILYLNGALRAILLSKSLSLATRIFLLLTLWVPLIGWIAGVGVGRTIRREYLAAVDRVEWERTIPLDGQCATRYPLVLVHGVGWRDRDLFNAWGRIPKYLKRHGAAVFHGEQDDSCDGDGVEGDDGEPGQVGEHRVGQCCADRALAPDSLLKESQSCVYFGERCSRWLSDGVGVADPVLPELQPGMEVFGVDAPLGPRAVAADVDGPQFPVADELADPPTGSHPSGQPPLSAPAKRAADRAEGAVAAATAERGGSSYNSTERARKRLSVLGVWTDEAPDRY